MLKRNPDLALWFGMTGLTGDEYQRSYDRYITQWIHCIDFIDETKKRGKSVNYKMASSRIAEQVCTWAAQKFGYDREIHEAAVIGAALTCGISYKRLPVTRTVIFALEEKP